MSARSVDVTFLFLGVAVCLANAVLMPEVARWRARQFASIEPPNGTACEIPSSAFPAVLDLCAP